MHPSPQVISEEFYLNNNQVQSIISYIHSKEVECIKVLAKNINNQIQFQGKVIWQDTQQQLGFPLNLKTLYQCMKDGDKRINYSNLCFQFLVFDKVLTVKLYQKAPNQAQLIQFKLFRQIYKNQKFSQSHQSLQVQTHSILNSHIQNFQRQNIVIKVQNQIIVNSDSQNDPNYPEILANVYVCKSAFGFHQPSGQINLEQNIIIWDNQDLSQSEPSIKEQQIQLYVPYQKKKPTKKNNKKYQGMKTINFDFIKQYEMFQFNNGTISLHRGSFQNYQVQLPFPNKISSSLVYSFKIEIGRCLNGNIMVGISTKQKSYNNLALKSIHYWALGNIWTKDEFKQNQLEYMGSGFKTGDQVQTLIDVSRRKIAWKVNNQVQAIRDITIKGQSFYPNIQFQDEYDLIYWKGENLTSQRDESIWNVNKQYLKNLYRGQKLQPGTFLPQKPNIYTIPSQLHANQ